MKRACTLAPALVAGSLVALISMACPTPTGDDGGHADAGGGDAASQDAGGPQDAGFDSGCNEPCGEGSGSPLTIVGACQGTLLRFCEDDCVVERDCAAEPGGPYSCGLIGRFNECLAGESQACEPDYWSCDPSGTGSNPCNGNYPCDESADLECSGGSDPLCVTSGTDAGVTDAHVDDAATGDVPADDAGLVPDSAVDADAAVEDVATAPDTAIAVDAAPVEDAAVVVDAATEDGAAIEDAAAVLDAGPEDVAIEDVTAVDLN